MTTNIQEQLATKTLEWAETTEEFVLQEAPLFVEELIQFSIFSNAAEATILLTVAIGLFVVSWKAFRIYNETEQDHKNQVYTYIEDEMAIAGTVLSTMIGLISLAIGVSKVISLFKVIIAPRLFLIEYLTDMM